MKGSINKSGLWGKKRSFEQNPIQTNIFVQNNFTYIHPIISKTDFQDSSLNYEAEEEMSENKPIKKKVFSKRGGFKVRAFNFSDFFS